MECIISIELGTNAVRVYAFDLAGKVIGFSKGAYPTFHPVADYSEQDPEQIFITMLYILKSLLSDKVHPLGYRVNTVCFSASMHSLLIVDKIGVPLTSAITWGDNRGKKEAGELQSQSLGRTLYEATGTPVHPMSPLIKIAWFRNNEKEIFDKAAKFLSIKTYIIHELTGVYMIDHSLASATGMLNIHTRKWEDQALRYAGISAAQLPDLVPISCSDCRLKRQYQVSLGLSADIKIIAGSSDGGFATLGCGIMDGNKATITIEDSAAMRVIGTQVINDPGGRIFNYILDDKYYVSGGPSNNGSIVFEWLCSQFADFKEDYDDQMLLRDLLLQAEKITAGADGLVFLPYLLGERAPIWNPNARGVYFGVNINHDRRNFIRATLEGILYEMYSIGKMLMQYRKIDTVSVNGSFGTIPLIVRMLADIFNKPMTVTRDASAVSMGAYLLGATSMGRYKNLEDAAKSVQVSAPVIPDPSNHEKYAKIYLLFERLTNKLGEEFELLANL
jgi:gluconokinase